MFKAGTTFSPKNIQNSKKYVISSIFVHRCIVNKNPIKIIGKILRILFFYFIFFLDVRTLNLELFSFDFIQQKNSLSLKIEHCHKSQKKIIIIGVLQKSSNITKSQLETRHSSLSICENLFWKERSHEKIGTCSLWQFWYKLTLFILN